ncbi:N-6 DNA methylase [Photobacterium carnosum]|uniref:Eco57I restriction-modification methylase domain-containing protein n=1 Tax=Photobacterium carnosum TaxID=2023717 RepID=UPI001E2D18E7|nr:N-6 DNA methylase [Photobacterium carnosum]MCD9550645.1 N-6 DNA methylase [Photobacterium carnosum]
MSIELESLIANFIKNDLSATYNETQTRTDFITPLLNILGWYVNNSKGLPNQYREVIEETQLKLKNEDTKRPDYELRIGRIRKLFVEAKKPSVNIENNDKSAFQARRYGYSAGLPITILTNFKQTAIYDTTIAPKSEDKAYVARIKLINVDELSSQYDVLSKYLSRDSVSQPDFLSKIITKKKSKKEKSFDEHFLEKIKEWRLNIAADLYKKDPTISSKHLTNFTQQIISRLIFLRICEDRDIEKFENLLSCSKSGYKDLINLIKISDKKYNSGLFEIFNLHSNQFQISDDIIKNIIEELYYPKSPYSFSVLDTEILGGIYDQFLCEEIIYKDNNILSIYKPEYKEAGGVVTTPRYIVDHMVNESILHPFSKISLDKIKNKKIIDICCGSGIFLISSYESLMILYCEKYKNDLDNHLGKNIIRINDEQYKLTFKAKCNILINNIFGIDIDPESVELAKLGLYLKLLEDEQDIPQNHILPDLENNIKCGNSLITSDEWEKYKDSLDYFEDLNFFKWETEFSSVFSNGGFDLIIGNPPYVRIQKLKKYSLDELNYYHSKKSPYFTANNKNIDKYFIFIERSINLINDNGNISLIIPNKFIANKYGELLRHYITTNNLLKKITNFGSIHIFKGKALNYTCILELSKNKENKIISSKVSNLDNWIQNKESIINTYSATSFTDQPWVFPDENISRILQKCITKKTYKLGDIANIFVGLQTSADNIYVIKENRNDNDFIYFEKDGKEYKIEKEILKPFIIDVQLNNFKQPTHNSWLIYPYFLDKNTTKVYSELKLSEKYPHAYYYLLQYKNELLQRSITGGKKSEQTWFQFGRSQSLNKMEQPKIILPVQSKTYRYSPDFFGLHLTGGGNGPYYLITPKNNKYSISLLLAILNNDISEAQIKLCTSIIGNGYYAHNKEFIENIFIPEISEEKKQDIESICSEIFKINSIIDQADTHQKIICDRKSLLLKEKLNTIIKDSFDLTMEEYHQLKNVSPE